MIAALQKNSYFTGMRRARTVLVVLLLVLLVVPLSAQFNRFSSIGVESSWYASIPSTWHTETLPLRSHASFGVAFTPISWKIFRPLYLGFGLQGTYVTRSIYYHTTYFRSFFAIGPSISTHWILTSRWALTAGFALLPSWYLPTTEYQTIYRIFITPEFQLTKEHQNFALALTAPFNFDIRKTYGAFSIGLGLTAYFTQENT